MNRSSKPISRRMQRVLITAIVAGLGVVAMANQVIVRTEVNVKSDTNDFADAVETVGANTKLEVLSQKDGWLRVRTPSGKEGYISEGDLPANSTLASVQGNGQTNTVSNDAALRGLEDDAESYAKTKNWNTDGVKQMIALGSSVTSNDLIAFGKAGHVGPKKYRQ
jgi:uncharacterized protein YjfI (DUF2170 family)